jgi:hypothetical protein
MMSQRTHDGSIMQATLPLGDMNPVSSLTSRSAGAGPVNLSGCFSAGLVVLAVGAADGVPSLTAGLSSPHPEDASAAIIPTVASNKLPRRITSVTLRRAKCVGRQID